MGNELKGENVMINLTALLFLFSGTLDILGL